MATPKKIELINDDKTCFQDVTASINHVYYLMFPGHFSVFPAVTIKNTKN